MKKTVGLNSKGEGVRKCDRENVDSGVRLNQSIGVT